MMREQTRQPPVPVAYEYGFREILAEPSDSQSMATGRRVGPSACPRRADAEPRHALAIGQWTRLLAGWDKNSDRRV